MTVKGVGKEEEKERKKEWRKRKEEEEMGKWERKCRTRKRKGKWEEKGKGGSMRMGRGM